MRKQILKIMPIEPCHWQIPTDAMATKIQLLIGWICSTTDFYFWGKGAVVEELQKNNECMIEELYRKMPEKEEDTLFLLCCT